MAHDSSDGPTDPLPAPDPGEMSTHAAPLAGTVGFVAPVRIAGFRLGRLLGAGGMGLVYEAEQESLGRRVAIKLMKPGLVVPELLARFESEGRLLARLDHENIAAVIDAGVHRDERGLIIPYLVMELIESGVTLRRYASERALAVAEKIEIVLGVCAAIAAAHAKGIIHRDLKPSNILVVPAGTWSGGDGGGGGGGAGGGVGPKVKLIDFGIAKVLESAEAGLTSTGGVLGTPEYMAPEQIMAGEVDHRADIYAIGAVLYELLCGRLPRRVSDRSNREQLRRDICERDATPLRQHDRALAPELEVIAATCLRGNPEDRYRNVESLAADLRAFLIGEPITARAETVPQRSRRALGRLVSRQRVVTLALVGGVAVLAGVTLVSPTVFRWTPASTTFNRAIAVVLPASALASDLPDVRVVAITDSTDMLQVAAAAGIEGLAADQRVTWRPVYAEVIRRLAQARVRAIGVDILFRRPSEHDGPLEDALHAARDAGTPVVLAAPGWGVDTEGRPAIAPRLADAAAWGPVIGGFTGPDTWSLDLLVTRPGSEPLASFALQVASLARAPEAELSFAIDRLVETRFLRRGTSRRASLRAPIFMRPSTSETIAVSDETLGLKQGDTVVQLVVPLDRRALEAATVPLERVLAMPPEELRAALGGQIVVIGNTSASGGDLYEPPDGAPMPGVWSHASGVQRLLRGDAIEAPSGKMGLALLSVCAAAGAGVGLLISSHTRRVIGLAGLTLLPLLGSVLWLRWGGVLWNPLDSIGTGWLAALLGFGLSRLARRATPLIAPDLATTARGTP